MSKPEFEFFAVETVGFTPCEGAVAGLTERILARSGTDGPATRILRFEPGTDTTANGVQVHDFWEEVYLVAGSFTDLTLGETFTAGMYACRPPGMAHGPWLSSEGCTTFEVRYRAAADEA
jgi:hypothetical protein